MREAAQPWEPRFVPPETAPATVRCLSNRKQKRLVHEAGQQQHCPRVLLRGAREDAMSGEIRAAATTQLADDEGKEPVGG